MKRKAREEPGSRGREKVTPLPFFFLFLRPFGLSLASPMPLSVSPLFISSSMTNLSAYLSHTMSSCLHVAAKCTGAPAPLSCVMK